MVWFECSALDASLRQRGKRKLQGHHICTPGIEPPVTLFHSSRSGDGEVPVECHVERLLRPFGGTKLVASDWLTDTPNFVSIQ
jgi:hypothetical protein